MKSMTILSFFALQSQVIKMKSKYSKQFALKLLTILMSFEHSDVE